MSFADIRLTQHHALGRVQVMAQLNIDDANPELSALFDRVLRGEEILFARAGRPLVRLVPVEAPPIERRPGRGRGQIVLSADFDGPLHAEFGAAFGLGED